MNEATFPVATTWMMQAADGCQAWVSACTGWQQELARFTDQRLAENRRTWAAFMSSRDVAGAMKVQQQWAEQAATDYTQEATKLAQLLTTLSLTGTTPEVQESAALIA
jgi:signal-transduction protein with cAMP-binding, CBS, and nucleotidyltransferase domain